MKLSDDEMDVFMPIGAVVQLVAGGPLLTVIERDARENGEMAVTTIHVGASGEPHTMRLPRAAINRLRWSSSAAHGAGAWILDPEGA